MAIMAAGPFANFLLAAVLYALRNMVGTVEPQAIVAAPAANSAAAQAGFRQGDRIVSIDHTVVRSWKDVRWLLLDALTSGGDIRVVVDSHDGTSHEHTLSLDAAGLQPDGTDLLARAGLRLAPGTPKIDTVTEGGAGAAAGVGAGEVIVDGGTTRTPPTDGLVGENNNS